MITDFSGLDFDDVYLHPQVSNVNSRTEVDLSVSFKGLELSVPFVASPMRGIVGTKLIIELSRLGGIGILHRFYKSDSAWKSDMTKLSDSGEKFGVAVKMGDSLDKIRYALDKGANIICVDLAHGYLSNLHSYCNEIAGIVHRYDALLMSGNVVCINGGKALAESGVDMVRGGIGNGRVCSTTHVTGVGKPQLQTVVDTMISVDNKEDYYALVSDGGITSTGDMVKALAAGADYLMMGSFFATAFESTNDGVIYGMSSMRHWQKL